VSDTFTITTKAEPIAGGSKEEDGTSWLEEDGTPVSQEDGNQ
jgi:hypothetical protein